MSQNVKTYMVQYNASDPTKPTFKDSGKADLKQNDWIEIHLNTAWPAGTTTTTVTFYSNSVVNGKDTKNTQGKIGSWTSTGGNGTSLTGIFNCSASGGVIKVTDTEILGVNSEVKYWFEVSGAVGGTSPALTWSVDPEVINKGRTG